MHRTSNEDHITCGARINKHRPENNHIHVSIMITLTLRQTTVIFQQYRLHFWYQHRKFIQSQFSNENKDDVKWLWRFYFLFFFVIFFFRSRTNAANVMTNVFYSFRQVITLKIQYNTHTHTHTQVNVRVLMSAYKRKHSWSMTSNERKLNQKPQFVRERAYINRSFAHSLMYIGNTYTCQ